MVMSCKGCKFPAEAWAEAPGLGNRPCGGLLNFIMQHGVLCHPAALHCSGF